ncbi:16S rRNA (guanine(527)-N(7))-methyltransferase RsmG [Neolewinella antarctica]|uniref:Ribosomal RNA small subunit methyltransferase G n=1 Tax=Neolewinella antarctica TaxID=442734 RepID=A0ABX0XG05_9BACT|nr:16S rRNA (guanine(527)-N(7))-methyltransferase RsmG [Neolewinella antarctica]NJC28253.1 16S rRNA (guanine527-N7)-methyltransferase [Neolewinella antarctica]
MPTEPTSALTAEIVHKFFPELTDQQKDQFAKLDGLYRDWNAKINVISRKDIDNLYPNHILHSLAIAKVVRFLPGAKILDLGTGGGFPGIPLAILFPETEFHLIDGIAKKVRVCNEVIEGLGLTNVKAEQKRAEELKKPVYDFVVTRAVARMEKISEWSMRLITKKQRHALPNGILALKGVGLEEEMKALPKKSYLEEFPIKDIFPGVDFYEAKAVIYLQY